MHTRAVDDDLIVEQLVEDVSELSDSDLRRIEKIALGDSEIAGRLVSTDGRTAGMVITLFLPEESEEAALEIAGHVDALLDEARADNPDIAFHMTGYVAVTRAMGEAVRDDFETLVPAVVLAIVILTIVLLRSVLNTIAVVVVMLFSVLSALGFVGWSGMVLSPVNSGLPIIVMVIAIADSIHVVTNALSALRSGLDRNSAIRESVQINAWPVFLTSLTTAIGFLSLNASDSPPFHVLGNSVAFGVLCAFIYSVLLLPALLSVLPLRPPKSRSSGSSAFDYLADFVIRRRTSVFAAFTLVVVGLAAGIPGIHLGDNLVKFFDDSYQVRRDTDFIVENLTGFDTFEYSLDSGGESGISDPDYLQMVDAFAEWFRNQPDVSHVQAFSDVMKRLNKNMHGDDPDQYRLPADRNLAAQYLLLYEFSLPFGRDLNDRIDIDKSATRLSVTISDATSSDLRAINDRAKAWLAENVPEFSQEATGLTTVVAYMTQRNINSMLVGTIAAMGLVSLILVAVLRSIRIGLLSLLPNFIPAIMTFGLWGHAVGQIGIVSSVVLAVVFGIVVDDTIHFLTKYLKARREGRSPPDSVRYAFHTVGPALWTTTLILAAGFLVFTLSGFHLSWVLGVLVACTILFALAADFLLLPILLMALDRKDA